MLRTLLALWVCAWSFSVSAATYVVTSAADSSDGTCDANCTLREAITAVNADGGGSIEFAIGSGPATIALATALPDLTAPVVLDATTQPGYTDSPLVQLTGISSSTNCVVLRAGDSTIRGLDLGNCADAIAVVATGAMSNIAIERNFLGTRLSTATINGSAISLTASATDTLSNVTIGNGTPAGRNVLTTFGFVGDALKISGNVSNVTVAGNYFSIGDDGVGLLAAARFITDIGVYGSALSDNILIGGSTPGARNVFGSAGGTQINVKIDSLGSNLTIEGNYIGTDPTGMIPRRATNFAVWLFGQGSAMVRNNVITAGNTAVSRGVSTTGPVTVQNNLINVKADGSAAFPMVPATAINDFSSVPGYTIDGNVIANYSTAIFVSSPGAVVQNNLIGLDPTGTTILGGGQRGIFTSFARVEPGVFIRNNKVAGCTTGIEIGAEALATVEGNFVGTNAAGTLARPNTTGITVTGAAGRTLLADNVIAGNTGQGVVISTTTMPVTMTGNRIGVSATGAALANGGDGIRVTSGTALKSIGTIAGTPNEIAYNGGNGVTITGGSATTIFHNSIHDNIGLGIDRGNDGVTATGAPSLTNVATFAGTTTVTGTLQGTPSTQYTIELYTNAAADPSNYGEAQTLLTRYLVTTDAIGSASVNAVIAAVPAGTILSATATSEATHDTSELSNDVIVTTSAVQFSVASQSVSESAGTLTLTVTRSGGTGAPMTVQFASTNGTATAGSDFTAVSGTLWFSASDTSQTIAIPIASDALDEPDETFTVALSNALNGDLGSPAMITVTIADDDAQPAISIGDTSVLEGNSGTTTLTFDVTLSAASGQPVTVDYTTVDGTAASGSDFGARFGTLTFAPGDTSRSVAITVNGDAMAEANETLSVLLSGAVNASIADGTATGTITNDDGEPSIAIADAMVLEGTTATLVMSLSNPSSSTVTVDWASTAYSASGTATFSPGMTTTTIDVAVSADTIVEGNETFFVDLTNATNASIGDAQAVVTVVDDDGSPALTISDLAVQESAGTAMLTVLLAPASAQTVTVDFTTASGSAIAIDDYPQTTGTLTFNPGETSKTISIPIVNDNVTESAEAFAVSLSNATNASIAGGASTVTIIDDDPTPTVTVGDVTVVEGTAASFVVTLSNPSASAVTVNYATASVTATAADYAAAAGTLPFAPGETAKTVNVATIADALQESDETFAFDLSSAANATVTRPRAGATITDDDGTPALLVGDATVAETDAGTVMASFVVTLAGNAAQTVTVDYATADGTANAGSDYAASSGHLIFAPGVTTQTIEVALIGDALVEPDETLFVTLSNATNATFSDNQGLGTITNDDLAPVVPAISIGNASVTEGNAGTASLTFNVTLSAATTVPVDLNYSTANGTATAGSDYAAASGTLVFAPGVTTQQITVAVAGDTAVEGDETLTVSLSTGASATGTILDDDTAPVVPTIAIGNASVIEGNAGTAPLTFNVTLSAATTIPINVNYATANGTATAGSDYASTSGTLVFAPGVTTQPITVAVAGDTAVEGDETFIVNLSTGASATGTILDDDTAPVVPTIAIGNASVIEGNAGTAPLTFNVTLSAATTVPVNVNYATANGTATAGSDYASTSGTLVFAPGVTTQPITVAVAGDTAVEGDESLTVSLSTGASATGTILDDDTAPVVPTIAIGNASVIEGNAGTAPLTFNVTLSAATTVPVNVNYATANGTATAGSDYASTSGTLVFAPGVTTQPITVAVAGDTTVEVDETFIVNLSTGASATGTILDDDTAPEIPSISIGNVTLDEGDAGARGAVFQVKLSSAVAATITVSYATNNGTATAGSDYASTSGKIVFAPNVTTQTISVAIAGDTLVEPDETFNVTLSHPIGATIADGSGRGTIRNDDRSVPPVVHIDDAQAGESDGEIAFTVTLSAPAAEPVAIQYATSDGTATAGADYVAATGTLAFTPGETSRTIAIALTNDTLVETDETFTLRLSNDAAATGTIHDDDGGVAAILVIGGSGPGNFGSFFRTTLQMHNPDDAAMAGNLIVRPMGGGVPRAFGYALAPHETRELSSTIDVSGFITIDLIPLTGALPRTAVRVFNDAGEQGRNGFTSELIPIARALTPGRRGILIAPDDATAARWNLGMRALSAGASLTFTLRRADGTIAATATRDLAENVLVQIPAPMLFDAAIEDNDAVEIRVSRGAAIVYGSSVENVTQDPSFAVAEPLP